MKIKQRAVSDEQKLERRKAILDAAFDLFAESSYEAVSMAAVAKRVVLAKGTLYLYFRTKEELFLALQAQEFQAWFDEMDGNLELLSGRDGPSRTSDVGRLISESLTQREVMGRLIAILHTVLERNIDYEAASHFKRMLLMRVSRTGSLVESCLPFLKPGEGARLLLRAYALVIGLRHLAEPAPVVREVIDKQGMDMFRVEFASAFSETVKALITGMAVSSSGGEEPAED
ncbi:MAG: TetR family transcriptional regulator [Deltaproteobacteria bacterium]